MGVGINLQPNAVRELFDLGLEAELDAIGVRTRQLGFYSKLRQDDLGGAARHWRGLCLAAVFSAPGRAADDAVPGIGRTCRAGLH